MLPGASGGFATFLGSPSKLAISNTAVLAWVVSTPGLLTAGVEDTSEGGSGGGNGGGGGGGGHLFSISSSSVETATNVILQLQCFIYILHTTIKLIHMYKLKEYIFIRHIQ